MQNIVVATGNTGKVKEISEWLSDFPFSLTSLKDHWDPVPDIPEEGETLEENAFSKARWVFSRVETWVLADDSGLEVDYLGGKPGVHSARYAGEHPTDLENIEKLLEALKDVPLSQRTARFRCMIVLMVDSDTSYVASGISRGHIGLEPRGENGFGYDPIFVPQGFTSTFGELDPGVKHAISHRGKALLNLRKELLYYRGKRFRS